MTPPDQLPAILQPGAPATSVDGHLVPALIADAGEAAAWRYIEFFTANIRNPNTRRAYARACRQFFAWCEDRGLTLPTIRPFTASGEMSDEEFFAFNVSWIGCALPWLCDGAVFGTFIDWRGYPTVHAASVKAGLALCIRETGASSTRFKDSRPGC